jgi:hypothetical protein
MDNIPVAHRLTTLIHPLPTLRRDTRVVKQVACGATTTIYFKKRKRRKQIFKNIR